MKLETKINFSNSKGDKLMGILNDTGKKDFILIMIHGFNSSKNHKYFLPLVERFAEKNISTFRFDTYGQGESDGKLEDLTISEALDDTMSAVNYVRSIGFKNIGLLGTSLGGFVAINIAPRILELKLLALKSPVSDYQKQVKNIASPEDLAAWKEKGFIDYGDAGQFVRLNYPFYQDLFQHDAYARAKEINVPVLIVHGEADTTVDVDQSKKLVNEFPNAKLVLVAGANHSYSDPSQSTQLLNAIYEFVLENI